MAIPWYETPRARVLLDGLKHSDLSIKLVKPIVGPDHFEYDLPAHVELEVDRIIDKAVNEEVGFTFEEANHEDDKRERWIVVYEQQVTLQSVLFTRFGDPNLLFGYGPEVANKIMHQDPGYLLRMQKMMTDWEQARKDLSNDND